MNAESTSLLKHDQHCPNHDDDDSFRARKTMTKTLATRAIVVVVCVAAIVGVTYMSTGTPSIDSHAAPVRISYMSILDDRRRFCVTTDHDLLAFYLFLSPFFLSYYYNIIL